MTTKEALHRLIDELPESELEMARRVLEPLRAGGDPVLYAFLAAPQDDEPLTPEEMAAIEEGEADIARGAVSPWDDVKARLFGAP